jgi:hypothetical protein
MLISILTSVVVFVTMIATTFAWVGIFTYASTDSFQMNLKVNKSSNYFLTISPYDSTVSNDFCDSVPLADIQKQVLNFWNIPFGQDDSASVIDSLYTRRHNVEASSPNIDDNGNINGFSRIVNLNSGPLEYVSTNTYIKFDVYLSVNTIDGITVIKDDETGEIVGGTSGINAYVALDEISKTLIGTMNSYNLINGNVIRRYNPSNFDWQYYYAHKSLSSITTIDGEEKIIDKASIRTDSSSAARFALAVYNPIKITDTYTGDETPINTIVYQGGSALPTYDETSDVYSMGGILPEEYNFAYQEANALYNVFNRGLRIPNKTAEFENNVKQLTGTKKDNIVWNAPSYSDVDINNVNYLGVEKGIQTKQKLTIYFWFEGWDSDCTWVIDRKSVTMNLTFTADIDI